jgi:CBS domain-containing protein/sporulation protein YlmC with PRC-barrel domain
MARSPVPAASALRARYEQRSERLTALRVVRDALVSLAGLVGRPVLNEAGAEIGTVADVVARWDDDRQPYPPVTGLVVRVGRRRAWVPTDHVAQIRHTGVRLGSSRMDLRDFSPRSGEVELFREVVDHQLIDTDGARVVRAADLYLADVAGTWQLVGVDVGFASIVRRLGPARFRVRPTPDKVIDWASIHSFGSATGSGGNLQVAGQGLRRLRPGELADLLEDLGRSERRELLAHLSPEQAADALEEMQSEELSQLLRESDVADAGRLLGQMEPDEAAEALRQLDDDEQTDLLAAMPVRPRSRVVPLLDYDEGTAGGLMTSLLITASPADTVGDVRRRLREHREHDEDLAGVVVVDEGGKLVDDLTMTELFLADVTRTVDELIGPPWPVTVEVGADAEEVAERLIESRSWSVVVVDDEQRPLGRILADDVIDALMSTRGAVHFPRRLS